MSKRRIKFKLGEIKISGIELEIEDEREHATAVLAEIQHQIAGAVQPALSKSLLGVGPVVDVPPANGQPTPTSPVRQRRKRAAGASGKGSDNTAQPITLIHDPDKYGNPQQGWSTPNKAIWLLWVVEQAANKKELSAAEIADTFNQHYRQFGTVSASNVTRDLGSQRKKNPAPVGTDPNRSPQVWFLYDAGKARAERLKSGWDGKGD
jgi:hypothetical protein